VIDFLARWHAEMWWDRYAMIGCVVAFVAGAELATWGREQARHTQPRRRSPAASAIIDPQHQHTGDTPS
jgi:hypothetical protein